MRLAGCRLAHEPDIFWVWVARDPCLIASPELSHVACAITVTIPEIIQIVGPDLHHFRSFIDECRAVVGSAQGVRHSVSKLLLNPVRSKAQLLV